MTRRGFLFGSLGATALFLGAASFGASKCSSRETAIFPSEFDGALYGGSGANALGLAPLAVANEAVFTTDQCQLLENRDEVVELTKSVALPYGTLVWADSDEVAACLLPCETSSPLTEVGLITLSDGKMDRVLRKAVTEEAGFEIYDVRANTKGIVWLEANIHKGDWRIYTAPTNGKREITGAPSKIAGGFWEWSCPTIVLNGDYVFWQTAPRKDSVIAKEPSFIMRAPIGGTEKDVITLLAHPGKFACEISPSEEGIVIASLVEGSKNQYQLLNVDGAGGEILKQIVLPQTMKPTYAAHGKTGFSFAFENIYAMGGGISNLGTYTPVGGNTSGEWFRFAKTPFATPAWSGNHFLVKSTSVVAGIDLAAKRYFIISPEYATQGFGEHLATQGTREQFVTFSNIDYTPLNSKHVNQCTMRVWRLKS